MREFRSSGSVRGVLSNGHPYRDDIETAVETWDFFKQYQHHQ